MRGKGIGLAIVVLALLLLATPGLAAGGMGPGHGQGTTVFALQGCITGINTDAETFEVDVVKSMGRSVLPDPATILTDEGTLFYEYYWDLEEEAWIQQEIDFGGLSAEPPDPVSVNGYIDIVVEEGEEHMQLWATRVTVNPDCPQLAGACD